MQPNAKSGVEDLHERAPTQSTSPGPFSNQDLAKACFAKALKDRSRRTSRMLDLHRKAKSKSQVQSAH
jgi:hypothetical protein